jgi:hypothetical protein
VLEAQLPATVESSGGTSNNKCTFVLGQRGRHRGFGFDWWSCMASERNPRTFYARWPARSR